MNSWSAGFAAMTQRRLGRSLRCSREELAVTIVLLMFVPALPLPTGGISHVFEVITVVLAAEMVLGRRTVWLPERWQRRELGATTTEKAIPVHDPVGFGESSDSHDRAALGCSKQGWMLRLVGLLLMVFAVGAAIAPPFSGLDTLPAMGAAAVALAIILEDMVVLAIGTVIGTGGIILILTVGAAIVRVLGSLVYLPPAHEPQPRAFKQPSPASLRGQALCDAAGSAMSEVGADTMIGLVVRNLATPRKPPSSRHVRTQQARIARPTRRQGEPENNPASVVLVSVLKFGWVSPAAERPPSQRKSACSVGERSLR